jgi:hypothetical protein
MWTFLAVTQVCSFILRALLPTKFFSRIGEWTTDTNNSVGETGQDHSIAAKIVFSGATVCPDQRLLLLPVLSCNEFGHSRHNAVGSVTIQVRTSTNRAVVKSSLAQPEQPPKAMQENDGTAHTSSLG